MNLRLEFQPGTALKIAEYLERSGDMLEANRLWLAINQVAAYDCDVRARSGDIVFDSREKRFEFGTIVRSQFILHLMSISFPTPKLVVAYFENLRQMLRTRPRLTRPGDIVLGCGSGRCGSTTLSAAFARVPDTCATHENPPHIFWQPHEEQVRFHFDRLRLLADYFPLVFDAAHWWLNVSRRVAAEFPACKFIGLMRETEPCVRSFLKFQGRGLGSLNNWAPPDNGIWTIERWDPTYPKYPLPPGIEPDTEEAYQAKVAMVTRYVTDYNRALCAAATANPDRVMLIRTEALNDPATATRLRDFVGKEVTMPAKSFNVGNDDEGAQPEFWY